MTMTAAARTAVEGFRQETRLESHAPHGPGYIVHALGRDFHVSDEMARIFLHQVERVAETDASALVILRHAHGVELLMVTDATSFSIRPRTAADQSAPAARGASVDRGAPADRGVQTERGTAAPAYRRMRG